MTAKTAGITWTEEVILTRYSNAWQSEMPVTLIRWSTGKIDLHCQTGDHHELGVEAAREILARRGLVVGKPHTEGATGWYYQVIDTAGKPGDHLK